MLVYICLGVYYAGSIYGVVYVREANSPGAESCGMLRFNQLHAAETCYLELIAVPQVYHLGHLH